MLNMNLPSIPQQVSVMSGKMRKYLLASAAGVEHGLCLMERQHWLTLTGMQDNPSPPASSHTLHSLKILPAYTGLDTVEAILQVPRARRLLWLEILFNDELDLQPWQNHLEVQNAYQKACQWFTTYRSLIQSVLPRVSLPLDNGKIDQRDYRTFAAALQFLAPSSSSTQ